MFCFCPKGNRKEERSGYRDERHNRGHNSRVSTFIFKCCKFHENVTYINICLSGKKLYLKQKLSTFAFFKTHLDLS